MQSSIILTALAAVTVTADTLLQIGVPKTIKSGSPFTILGKRQGDNSVWDNAMQLGLIQANQVVRPETLEALEGKLYHLPDYYGDALNVTIPGVVMSRDPGSFTLKALVLFYSKRSVPGLHVYAVNTTFGKSTSTEYVWSSAKGPAATADFF